MKYTLIYLCLCLLPMMSMAQDKKIANRYAMKLTENADGTYSLTYAKKYAKIVDVNTIPDVLVPYTHQAERLRGKDYNGVTTEDIVFKKYADYELKLTIDHAESTEPAPFVIVIHGGGWARGNNSSSRPLSQYLAKQKGITGVRVSYTLAPQTDATVEVSIQDIRDAVSYVQEHAKELNINPECIGFIGTSAGAHLASVAAMTTPNTKVLVGYSGIYDLETASIVQRSKDEQRIAYFCDRDAGVLHECSAINLIPKKKVPAALIVCGTCDVTVECEQSERFAAALQEKGSDCELLEYEYYDHNLTSKASDKQEEIFFKTVDFVAAHMK